MSSIGSQIPKAHSYWAHHSLAFFTETAGDVGLTPAFQQLPECSSAPGQQTISTFPTARATEGFNMSIMTAERSGESPHGYLNTWDLNTQVQHGYLNT